MAATKRRLRIWPLIGALFGSWLRVITSLKVGANLVVLLAVGLMLSMSDRSSQFRIDATTDTFSGIATTELRWAEQDVLDRAGDAPLCARAAATIPAGATITGARDRQGRAYIQVTADASHILIKCAHEDAWRTASRLILGRRATHTPPSLRDPTSLAPASTPPDKPSAAAGRESGQDDLTPILPIRLRALVIGGAVDEKGAAEAFDILRSGRLVSDVHSIPSPTASVGVERALDTGDIVTFNHGRYGDQAQGLVLLGDKSLRILARTRAQSALVTRPGAEVGDVAIVAPTFLARLEAQAEWGVFVIMGVLMLNILAALAGYLPMADGGRQTFGWARKRGGLPAMLGVIGMVLTAASGPAKAQPVTAHPPFMITVGGQQGQGFGIANPKGGAPNCLIVTAGHLVGPGDDIVVQGWINQRNWTATATFREKFPDDIAILSPKSDVPGGCAPFPTLRSAAAQTLLDGDTPGRVTYLRAATGPTFVRAIADPIDYRTTRLTSLSSERGVEPSFSGALFSISGTPLGMVVNISGGSAIVLRLDYAATAVRRYIAATAPLAYDTTYMPAEYQAVVKKAQDFKLRVDRLRSEALKNERSALEAARMASNPTVTHGRVLPDKNPERVYEGEIKADGSAGQGFGVMRFQSGPQVGREFRGPFRALSSSTYGLVGAGVEIFGADRAADFLRREAEFDETGMMTLVAITRRDGIVVSCALKNDLCDGPGMREFPDGRRLDATWKEDYVEGAGVFWDAQGQPLCICVYKKGQLVEDKTAEILSAR